MFTVTYIIAVIKIVTIAHVTITYIVSYIITVYDSAQSCQDYHLTTAYLITAIFTY